MSEHFLWRLASALKIALNDRHFDALDGLIADHIEWSVFGPTDMFPFLGTYRGKDAVIGACQQIANVVTVDDVVQESAILGHDSSACMLRVSLSTPSSRRPINLRLAKFIRFEHGKLVSMRAVMDTFDLVEQTLGHEIHLPQMA